MKKSVFSLALALGIIFTMLAAPAFAVNRYVDGNGLSSVQPRLERGVTLVPMRGIFETLGATVDYNGTTKTITAQKDGTKITLTVNNKTAYVNGKSYKLDVPAKIIRGTTLVPVRFISEALQATVDYNGSLEEVTITAADGATVILFDLSQVPSKYVGAWKLSLISIEGFEISPQLAELSSTLYLGANDNATLVLNGESFRLDWTVENGAVLLINRANGATLPFNIVGSYLVWYALIDGLDCYLYYVV